MINSMTNSDALPTNPANLYTAQATAVGGRAGHVRSSDNRLDLDTTPPGEMGSGTNPEQLFAAGYAACFQSALGVVGRRMKLDTSQSEVTAQVGLQKDGLAFKLDVELHVRIPGVDKQQAEEAVKAAHQVCPYSVATRGNVDVRLSVD